MKLKTMKTWSLTPLDQLSQFRKAPQDEIDIESPIALAAKSRDQRLRPIRSDCSHNHQWFFFSYSSFLMKKYFLMLTAEMPPIFQFTSKSCFPSYSKFITELSDLWMSGDTEERMRQRRFMRGALGRELQTFGGTSFFLWFLSSSSLPLLLASSPASFS